MRNSFDISVLKQALGGLPLISGDIPGIGGIIKSQPEHFQVEEILPYAPCGEGEHLYVTLRRKNWNTADVARELAAAFGCTPPEVGWGGRKDKRAVTTQTFSIPMPVSATLEESRARVEPLPFEILAIRRHGNKIKTGHVATNRFDVLITGVQTDTAARAEAIANRLKQKGLPNFYGVQRFGHQMGNLDQGLAILLSGRKARGRKTVFLVSAIQSALFNLWLRQRMERGQFGVILPGDIAKKTDTGGMFQVTDTQEAAQRFEAHQIVYTGPIFGHKMKRAGETAGMAEDSLLDGFGLTRAHFKRLRAGGTRRPAVLYPDDLEIAPSEQGLRLRFSLPAGAYATTLLREFTRP
jgi:tRNA pseudouridine13 synthase